MKTFRLIAAVLFLLPITLLANQYLFMHLDSHRFLDQDRETVVFLDYQIPYQSLLFEAGNGAYFAQVEVGISISAQDSLLSEQKIDDVIGITNKFDAQSMQKAYFNRIAIPMDQDSLTIVFTAKDVLSEKVFSRSIFLKALPKDSRLSDIELNNRISEDDGSYMKKFRRGNRIFEPAVSLIISKNHYDHAIIYTELYSREENLGENLLLILNLSRDDKTVMEDYLDLSVVNSLSNGLNLKIPLEDLEAGTYVGKISLLLDDIIEEKEFDLVVSEEKEILHRLFTDMDEEYALMRYFMVSKLPRNWDSMKEESKRYYISNFWKEMALTNRMSVDGIIDLVQERVDHSNQYFASIKPGWQTDMGRVYVRQGRPSDIEKGQSSTDSRFAIKDYQIWKYSTGEKPVYLFIDIQMNNNYRLIYVDGDDMEANNPDWLRYLGSDFDENLLRN